MQSKYWQWFRTGGDHCSSSSAGASAEGAGGAIGAGGGAGTLALKEGAGTTAGDGGTNEAARLLASSSSVCLFASACRSLQVKPFATKSISQK